MRFSSSAFRFLRVSADASTFGYSSMFLCALLKYFVPKRKTAKLVQGYVSDELHHFAGRAFKDDPTRQYEVLKEILSSKKLLRQVGFRNGDEVRITINHSEDLLSEKLVETGMVCFCDIPKEQLSIHVSKYGKFGLSFPRKFLVMRGARPVLYFPYGEGDQWSVHGRPMLTNMEEAFKVYWATRKSSSAKTKKKSSRKYASVPKNEKEAIQVFVDAMMRDILSYLKPFNSDLSFEDPNNFYMEREWRMNLPLNFLIDDVCCIFVAKGFGYRVRADFPSYDGPIQEL